MYQTFRHTNLSTFVSFRFSVTTRSTDRVVTADSPPVLGACDSARRRRPSLSLSVSTNFRTFVVSTLFPIYTEHTKKLHLNAEAWDKIYKKTSLEMRELCSFFGIKYLKKITLPNAAGDMLIFVWDILLG